MDIPYHLLYPLVMDEFEVVKGVSSGHPVRAECTKVLIEVDGKQCERRVVVGNEGLLTDHVLFAVH